MKKKTSILKFSRFSRFVKCKHCWYSDKYFFVLNRIIYKAFPMQHITDQSYFVCKLRRIRMSIFEIRGWKTFLPLIFSEKKGKFCLAFFLESNTSSFCVFDKLLITRSFFVLPKTFQDKQQRQKSIIVAHLGLEKRHENSYGFFFISQPKLLFIRWNN